MGEKAAGNGGSNAGYSTFGRKGFKKERKSTIVFLFTGSPQVCRFVSIINIIGLCILVNFSQNLYCTFAILSNDIVAHTFNEKVQTDFAISQKLG